MEDLLKRILTREIVPATGCTEVGAVALAAGWAAHALGGPSERIEEISVEVDERTYKNALGAGIPGTNETGLGFAAAIGALSPQNVGRGLQILENPNKNMVDSARILLQQNKVQVKRDPAAREILILAKVRSGKNWASAIIRGSHDHVVGVERNGKSYTDAPVSGEDLEKSAEEMRSLRYRDLVGFVKSMKVAEFSLIRRAMEMNMHFAKESEKRLPDLNMGKVLEKYGADKGTGKEIPARARHITAAAVEARMRGLDLPVMACAGSGNQGLVSTIPVVETAKALGVSEEQLLRALTLSYLTTIYIKSFTGLLSPVCGCGLAAAVGSGCGMVFLLGGDVSQIEAQINNMVGTMAGIICDGGKSGCALKALMAVDLAMESVYLSLENIRIPPSEGIVGKEVADTLRNLQQIIESMTSLDTVLVDLMEKKEGPKG